MKKSDIEDRGISGLAIDGRHVALVRRGKPTVLVLRHAWAENVDGRVASAVRRAWRALAQEQADRVGRSVEVYSRDGSVLDEIRPRPIVVA